MSKRSQLVLFNLRVAKATWTGVSRARLSELKALTNRYSLCVATGDVQFFDERWYVTHAGLLRLAERRHCAGINVRQVLKFCDPAAGRWVFRAIIYKNSTSRGFVGYGDADPSNTSALVRGAEMRVAETRAVNRALRKAYGIGLCSVEELAQLTASRSSAKDQTSSATSAHPNGSNNRQPRLRDRLCVLIRQYGLDPSLVKAYAADFCGAPALREANRELLESFVSHLATSAEKDRDALICRLNSFAQPAEVKA